jgi:hypothetical protein
VSALDQLNGYLQSIERRLRLLAISRGAALLTLVALVTTVVLVLAANRFGFSERSLWMARTVLGLSLAAAISWGVIPLFRLSRRFAAESAETSFPEFQERLFTVLENPDRSDLFVQLVAKDALAVARTSTPERLISSRAILGFVSSAGISLALLAWLFLAGPGYLGYGTSLLWAGVSKTSNQPLYDIVVKPGDVTVRRNSSQSITAQLAGFTADNVRLYVKYGGESKWEHALMRPRGQTFEFLFGGLAQDVAYYIEAGPLQTKHYTLRVADLPGVKNIRVTYRFPSWTGLKPAIDDPGGDLRAVEGTAALVAIETDQPLDRGILAFQDDSRIPLKHSAGNWLTALVPIQKDGMYHIAAIERDETIRLSNDYFIEARKDLPPIVKLVRPARDTKVNPIEEVPVVVEASDDFGLLELNLQYSVNGGPENSVPLLSRPGAKEVSGRHTIALEDYKIVPGDVVMLYATARDAHSTVKSEMYFIQAEPFERQYSQAQSDSMEGGEAQQRHVSDRQKEIIAATWNEIKQGAKDDAAARADADSLGQVQEKLAEQARSLAQRMRARELSGANQEFQSFAADMEAAATEMTQSAEKIKSMKWSDALAPAQKALQRALRAESVFRDIQVAFKSSQDGGGEQGMERDLESLFDLELDTEKNQYEGGQQKASNTQRDKELDEALEKVKALARRQQELAQQQQKKNQASPQRWEQESLRRETEELQHKMEQLQRGEQQQGNSQGRQAGMRKAIEQLKQATDDMRSAGSTQNGPPEQSAAGQRRAAGRLQDVSDLLNGFERQQASGEIDDLVRRTELLSGRGRDCQNRLRQLYGNRPENPVQRSGQKEQVDALASEKEQMAGELKKIEEQIGNVAQAMAGPQAAASLKLRYALSEVQQSELVLRMHQGAQSIRQGEGLYIVPREPAIIAGLDRLQQQLKDAQAALHPGDSENEKLSGNQHLEKALAQLERTREQIQQSNQMQQGKPSQQQTPGSQQNGKRQAAVDPQIMSRELRSELTQLRQNLQGNKEMLGQVQELMGLLEKTSAGQNGAQLSDLLSHEVAPGLERLELELRTQLGQNTAQVRNAGSDSVPAGYADALANYFRKLSQGR